MKKWFLSLIISINRNFLLNFKICLFTDIYSFADSPLDDSESPWVPNVVLVENDLGNSSLGNCSENVEALNDILHENGSLHNFPSNTTDELSFEGIYVFTLFLM